MNDLVKGCVESRKTAIFSTYDIKNQDTLNKIEDFFKRLESFADNYNDAMQFETALASSELNKEYMELFTQIATNETAKNISTMQEAVSNANETKSEAQELAEEIADDVTHSVRRQARQQAYDKVRDIPVVGDVLNVKQHIDFFSRFKKKKD